MSVVTSAGYTLRRAAAILGQRPVRFVLGIVVSAVAIALLIGAAFATWITPQVVRQLGGPQINIFVTVGTPTKDVDALQARVLALPGAPTVMLIPRDKALAELAQRAGAAAAEPRSNPLPDVLVAQYAVSVDPALVEQSATAAREWAGIDKVQAELAWHRRLHSLGGAAGAIAAIVGGATALLALFALLVAAAAQARPPQYQAEVLRITGATTGFIARPYACAAALTLALGALLALALLAVLASAAQPQLAATLDALPASLRATAWPSPAPWLPVAIVGAAAVAGWVVGGLAALLSARAEPASLS